MCMCVCVSVCRWVLVHGMAGFGKTVLAAEAVRDATILKNVFPGKIGGRGGYFVGKGLMF